MPHHPTFCPAFPPAALRATPHASPPALPHHPPPISPPPAPLPLHRLPASLPAATRHPNPRRVVVTLLCVGACARCGATHCHTWVGAGGGRDSRRGAFALCAPHVASPSRCVSAVAQGRRRTRCVSVGAWVVAGGRRRA